MGIRIRETRIEQPGDGFDGQRTKPDATAFGFHFHQRFQPAHSSRSVAHQFDGDATRLRVLNDGSGDLIGTTGVCTGIAWNVDAHVHDAFPQPSINASSRCRVSRPCTLSSSIALGAQAQLPRQ